MPRHYIRPALLAAVAMAIGPLLLAPAKETPPAGPAYYIGKVVPLRGVLEKSGIRLDRDADPTWLALVTDDGKVYPLIKDDGARMFFKDERLRGRPMRLTGKLLAEPGLLQGVRVHSRRA